MSLIEVLLKFLAAMLLYAYLLHRGGVRRGPAVAVSLAHLAVLFCLFPVEHATTVWITSALGACTYAVLVVQSAWLRAGIVVVVAVAYFGFLGSFHRAGVFIAIIPMSLWVGAAIIARDWARGHPVS